ncbi:YmfL family putative regulatory protein [Pseudomonas sp. R5(2019)]|uniref:YmfL family putative regulatory protein n=1 Tax=Pseudomonas sp. R5(2019) TaxID=2697566 RepID=UPI00273D04EF|nr:YmfL family putative regulatory protein [Pseudomonas sp. R5(2019)]
MKSSVLKTRRQVVSAIICAYSGGRECAAARIGLSLKKFDNHAYENNNSRPLTDVQIYQLELEAGTTHLPEYIAAMYGGMFVPVAEPDSLDNVEMYTRCVQAAAKKGTVDHLIAEALKDEIISEAEAEAILHADSLHLAARHAEVLAVIQLHASKSGKSK